MSNFNIKENRTANLNRIQESRKQETLAKVELALERMQKQGMKINFSTVALEANVSQSYLYKYPEVKIKIAEIRNQQSLIPRCRTSEPASAKSHLAIVSRFKDRIKNLEAEVTKLRNINEGLAGRVYRLVELEALTERQQKHIQEIEDKLRTYSTSSKDSKIASFSTKKSQVCNEDTIKSELNMLNIQINSTLSKLIEQTPSKVVLEAIEALKKALLTTNVRSPSGFLVEAIKNTWIPNPDYKHKSKENSFDEWYSLAIRQKIVLASTIRDGVQYVLTKDSKWVPFEEIAAEYPLERLQTLA